MILDDAVYLAMLADLGSTYGWIRKVVSNVGNTITKTENWGGYLTSLNDQFQGSGPSDVAGGFRANESIIPA